MYKLAVTRLGVKSIFVGICLGLSRGLPLPFFLSFAQRFRVDSSVGYGLTAGALAVSIRTDFFVSLSRWPISRDVK